ncbi:hypothetical protein LR48_Vigan08g170200 [Vigna angularis]|uniref:BZIP domain-containing protein n=1 Tax=Phaseolus angularis TaxID=3914 RepID=A0A0L9V722_PHAAN|nr:hypothetical protein LR48_Vigan08g170200 [Vigna angularis]
MKTYLEKNKTLAKPGHKSSAPMNVGQSSLLASANTLQRTSAENNMGFKNHSYKISQPTSNVTPKAKENERRPSIQGTNLKGSTSSVTSESKQRTAVVNDKKNDGGSTKVHIRLCNRQDIRSTKQQQSRMMSGTVGGAKSVTHTENINADDENTNIETENFEANPSDPNQNLHIDLNASSANPVLEEGWPTAELLLLQQESDDTKEQRKRKAMNKSFKRRKKIMKLVDIFSAKHEQSSMTVRNGGGANNVTSIENSNSIQDKTNIGSNHFGANPTERNRNLSTKLSATNPQLTKEESDEEKEQRRQSKKKSAKRSRMKMKMERERLNASIENLGVENAALREKLHDLLHECDKLIENNNSILDELNEMYGKEKVMEVLSMQYADSGQC